MNSMKNIMIALDNMNKSEVESFLDSWTYETPTIKIGLEMFCKMGPDYIRQLYNKYKFDIFLDLKLHDIPNTVKKSVLALEGLPIKFLTIHLGGGLDMINAAVNAAKTALPEVQILGVSFLTSLSKSDLNELYNIENDKVDDAFRRLFKVALKSDIHGVVLSANELNIITELEKDFSKKLIKVCPGIRFPDEISAGQIGDQKRVLDPKTAFSNGADYLVMGRSLTTAKKLSTRVNEIRAIFC